MRRWRRSRRYCSWPDAAPFERRWMQGSERARSRTVRQRRAALARLSPSQLAGPRARVRRALVPIRGKRACAAARRPLRFRRQLRRQPVRDVPSLSPHDGPFPGELRRIARPRFPPNAEALRGSFRRAGPAMEWGCDGDQPNDPRLVLIGAAFPGLPFPFLWLMVSLELVPAASVRRWKRIQKAITRS